MPREYALLEFFMRHPNRTFTQNELLDEVWSKDSEASPDTVRVHITKLRAKIDNLDKGQESLIKTVHRVGYRFEKSATSP
ncbi:MAG: winged helix-turn-helix transcriptional regulator [Candidatus Competibacteraceae bacterium]|nr:winged helix-turn-helix transcriptional regulator [Candidatus Competibacteraceae bacterium]